LGLLVTSLQHTQADDDSRPADPLEPLQELLRDLVLALDAGDVMPSGASCVAWHTSLLGAAVLSGA